MAQKPFPSTDEAFAEVRREEARRKVMLSDDKSVPPSAPKVSALMTTKTHSNGQQHPDHRSNKRPWCDHCNRPGHTRDKCWEIHGKPANWQSRKKNDGRAHHTQSNQDHSGASIPFSKEQIDQLCKLLNLSSVNASQTHPPNYANSTSGSCSVAKSGPIIGEDDWQC
ncbi:uncharacterized protein LOC112097755 isoform X2 [Citrus clementina]|uniref:uncharacterized protein LOC112097755 isoform X2 n=1 Tax=Citrus clementina TaxID=85681 RepID=UPI000CED6AED|nr:uncharacterized protein LOC112097755 isoform X2 [Citrus x clementina]